MADFAHITRCSDVCNEDVDSAKSSRQLARALVERMTQVAAPDQGASNIVAVLSHIAQADWFDGGMRIEIGGDADVCVVDVLSELGVGFSERVWPTMAIRVPIQEFRQAVRQLPSIFLPLKLKHDRPNRIILTVKAEERFSSMPPPVLKVGDADMVWGNLMQSPPPVFPKDVLGKTDTKPNAPSSASPALKSSTDTESIDMLDDGWGAADDALGAPASERRGQPISRHGTVMQKSSGASANAKRMPAAYPRVTGNPRGSSPVLSHPDPSEARKSVSKKPKAT